MRLKSTSRELSKNSVKALANLLPSRVVGERIQQNNRDHGVITISGACWPALKILLFIHIHIQSTFSIILAPSGICTRLC